MAAADNGVFASAVMIGAWQLAKNGRWVLLKKRPVEVAGAHEIGVADIWEVPCAVPDVGLELARSAWFGDNRSGRT
jgi:hypothetical protein